MHLFSGDARPQSHCDHYRCSYFHVGTSFCPPIVVLPPIVHAFRFDLFASTLCTRYSHLGAKVHIAPMGPMRALKVHFYSVKHLRFEHRHI